MSYLQAFVIALTRGPTERFPISTFSRSVPIPAWIGGWQTRADARIHGRVILGVVVTCVAAYVSVRFPLRRWRSRTLAPLAVHSLVAGAGSSARFV